MAFKLDRREVIAATASLIAAPAIVRAQGQNGVALVIGNSKYQWEASLPNVKRDAPDIAKAFQTLGLKTELLQDVGSEAMLAAIEKFKAASRGAKLAAFYFAGHGVTWEKQSYIVPVDADLSDPKTAQSLISVPSIDAAIKEAANRLLVFDNCRNNPADGWKQREAKIQAKVEAADKVATDLGTANTLTLFSTASGNVALDGPPGQNSPFAAALLRQLDAPSVDLQPLPAKLRRDLLIATEGRQLVWDINAYTGPFTLERPGKAPASPAAHHDPSRIVELNQAYAFAKQNSLVLPPGLVALRPAANASDARMIGSYKFEIRSMVTGSTDFLAPALFIILSVAAGNSAELVYAGKDWNTGNGARWRLTTATKTEDTVSFLSVTEHARLEFKWTDQNSGKFTNVLFQNASGRSGIFKPSPFTRLDG